MTKAKKPARKSAAKARKPASKKAASRARPARKKVAKKKLARPAAKSRAKKPASKARASARPKKKVAAKRPVAKGRSAKPAAKGKAAAKTAPKSAKALAKIPAKLLPKSAAKGIVAKAVGKGAPGVAPLKGAKGAAVVAPVKGAKGAPAPAPGHKPTPSEIAARIAGKRAEEAASKKGRNGKHAEIAPRVLTAADVEARKRRLKNLIVLGKERGFLTFAEINDHLPDDVLDAEQIEAVISMIGDMGIQVYDEAPDAETLLLSDAAPTAPIRGRRGSRRSGGLDARLRIRPHHRPRPHVHARDGIGRAPHARRRDRDRQAHRGRPEAHDHGDLGLPDDGRADPGARRHASARMSSRSTISSTA